MVKSALFPFWKQKVSQAVSVMKSEPQQYLCFWALPPVLWKRSPSIRPFCVRWRIADDHKGLRSTASEVFYAGQQRSRVHRMRNELTHAAPMPRPPVIAMIKTTFAQETAEAERQQWQQVADGLREKVTKASQ